MFFLRRQVKNIKEKKKNKKKEMIIRTDKGSSICQGSEQSFPVFFSTLLKYQFENSNFCALNFSHVDFWFFSDVTKKKVKTEKKAKHSDTCDTIEKNDFKKKFIILSPTVL